MNFKGILIAVGDIEKSKKFYCALFGFETVADNDGNLVLSGGLVLQDKKIWKEFLNKEIMPKNNSCELYFETQDIDGFVKKLVSLYPETQFVNTVMTHTWGQKVVRFYDLDGNLVEVGTPMPF